MSISASVPAPASLASIPIFSLGAPLTSSTSVASSTHQAIPSLSSLLASVTSGAPPLPKPKPLAYSPVLPPVPVKVMEKIRAGGFVDFKELLLDNITLSERLQALGQPGSQLSYLGSVPTAPRLRSISDPLTWACCFLAFMAASTESDATREMAAYAQIVVMQARKHPGGGWLAYDQQFRQQRAAGLDLKWNDLSPSIMAATVLRSAHETCTLCHFPDHATEQCALFSQEPPKAPKPPVRQSPYRVKPYAVPKAANSEPCRRFNRGSCPSTAETCRYAHTCSACEKPGHGAVSCPEPLNPTPKDGKK